MYKYEYEDANLASLRHKMEGCLELPDRMLYFEELAKVVPNSTPLHRIGPNLTSNYNLLYSSTRKSSTVVQRGTRT